MILGTCTMIIPLTSLKKVKEPIKINTIIGCIIICNYTPIFIFIGT